MSNVTLTITQAPAAQTSLLRRAGAVRQQAPPARPLRLRPGRHIRLVTVPGAPSPHHRKPVSACFCFNSITKYVIEYFDFELLSALDT